MSNKFDVIVIGSGPGGYVAAIKASQGGKSVAIVEKQHLGGICLNWGCIPTKALLKSAEVFHELKHAKNYGLKAENVGFEYPKIVERSRDVAAQNANGVKFLMKKNKITVIDGAASIVSKGVIEVVKGSDKSTYFATHIIIATGASPRKIPAFPVDGKNIITYRHALEQTTRPEKLLVVGSGAIGTEFSYFYNCLGTEIHLVEMLPTIVPLEDEEIGKTLEKSFQKQGINTYTSTQVLEVKVIKDGEIKAILQKPNGDKVELLVNQVLVAIGMVPNTDGLNLEKAGIKLNERGFIAVDEYQQTSISGIYAIGDVAGRQMLAHKASFEGEVAVAHLLGQHVHPLHYGQIPGCTYCVPQIASIGLTEKACKEKNLEVKIGRFPFQASGKARAIGNTEGFVKLIFGAKHGELLGAHLIGPEATEMLSEMGLALKLEATYEEIIHTVHAHPTLSEAMMEAAADSQGIAVHI